MSFLSRRLTPAPSHPPIFAIVAGSAGFSAYFAMYACRKPFAAATFAHVAGWPFALDYKVALVLAQVAGYALSKFIGVKVVSEIAPRHRSAAIIGRVGLSWLALIAFALIPPPWNVLAFFVNGLPLGMIWGLVYGYMEGRRISELLAAMLCASFILSSGVVKSVGLWLMQAWGVSAFWMPAATGALFLPMLFVSVWVLNLLPPPSARDEAERVRRAPMDANERRDRRASQGRAAGRLRPARPPLRPFRIQRVEGRTAPRQTPADRARLRRRADRRTLQQPFGCRIHRHPL
jgi:hypothetical protein